MYTTSTYVATRIARDYTRDRSRDAEARRAVHDARTAARERRNAGAMVKSAVPVRRWWVFATRTTTA